MIIRLWDIPENLRGFALNAADTLPERHTSRNPCGFLLNGITFWAYHTKTGVTVRGNLMTSQTKDSE